MSGDPLSLLEKVNNISAKLIKKEKRRVEKRGEKATKVKYFEPPKKIEDRVDKFTLSV